MIKLYHSYCPIIVPYNRNLKKLINKIVFRINYDLNL